MRKAMIVCLIGFISVLLPYIGIPDEIREYILVVTGGLLLVLGYLLIRDEVVRRSDFGNGERGNDSYVETTESLFSDDTLQ